MRKKKARQPVFDCFSEGQDLPIFTGTPMRCEDETFTPSPSEVQPSLFGRSTFSDLAAEKALAAKIAIDRHHKRRRRRRRK